MAAGLLLEDSWILIFILVSFSLCSSQNYEAKWSLEHLELSGSSAFSYDVVH